MKSDRGEKVDKNEILKLKKKIFLTAYRAGAAHLASSFSVMDILYVLYCKEIIDVESIRLEKEDRDRVILSKGHACLAQYVVLNRVGLISDEELNGFCQEGSHLGGEPRLGSARGIEASTGSLGHGLPYAVGIAMAYRLNNYQHRVYVVIGDGECQEGSVWEAVMSAVNFKLDNLTVIMDNNRLQAMGSVEEIMGVRSWKEKWESFGFDVLEVDGHDTGQIKDAVSGPVKNNVPRLVIANTIKGKGVSFMEGVPIWHYRMPDEEELQVVKRELQISDKELRECGIHT